MVEDIFAAFGDLFGQFFASTSHHIGTTLELTDAEAAEGCVREVVVQRRSPCMTCNARGTANPSSESKPCAQCDGTGQQKHTRGFFIVQTTCAACKGIGSIIKDPCKTCSGTRSIATPAKVTITVPPAVEHGATLRLSGEGSTLADGTVGDLSVYVLVGGRPDPRAAAFEQEAVPVELPRATVRAKRQRVSWSLIAAITFAVLLVLILAAR